ncbi:hypothetical protein JCM11641_000408 [Rhodosporidiobolus odoratus]
MATLPGIRQLNLPRSPKLAAQLRNLFPHAHEYLSHPQNELAARLSMERLQLREQIRFFVPAFLRRVYSELGSFQSTMGDLLAKYEIPADLLVVLSGRGDVNSPLEVAVPAFMMGVLKNPTIAGGAVWSVPSVDYIPTWFDLPGPALLPNDERLTRAGEEFRRGAWSTSRLPDTLDSHAFPNKNLNRSPATHVKWRLLETDYRIDLNDSVPYRTTPWLCTIDFHVPSGTGPGTTPRTVHVKVVFDAELAKLQAERSGGRPLRTMGKKREYWPEARWEAGAEDR